MNVIEPKSAAAAYRQGLLAGTWTLEDSRRILATQDDPDELIGLIKEANQDPEVLAALRRLMGRATTTEAELEAAPVGDDSTP